LNLAKEVNRRLGEKNEGVDRVFGGKGTLGVNKTTPLAGHRPRGKKKEEVT